MTVASRHAESSILCWLWDNGHVAVSLSSRWHTYENDALMESICPYEKEKYPKRVKKVVEIEFTSPRDHSSFEDTNCDLAVAVIFQVLSS